MVTKTIPCHTIYQACRAKRSGILSWYRVWSEFGIIDRFIDQEKSGQGFAMQSETQSSQVQIHMDHVMVVL